MYAVMVQAISVFFVNHENGPQTFKIGENGTKSNNHLSLSTETISNKDPRADFEEVKDGKK